MTITPWGWHSALTYSGIYKQTNASTFSPSKTTN